MRQVSKPVNIAIAGEFQIGKSTLLNALLGRVVTQTGNGLATTRQIYRFGYAETEKCEFFNSKNKLLSSEGNIEEGYEIPDQTEVISVCLRDEILKKCVFYDMPGFNALENDSRLSSKYLTKMDFVLVMVNDKQLSFESVTMNQIIRPLEENRIPYALILNPHRGQNSLDHPDIQELVETNDSILKQSDCKMCHKIQGRYCFPVQILWYWASICERLGYNDTPALSAFSKQLFSNVIRSQENNNPGGISQFTDVKDFLFGVSNKVFSVSAPLIANLHREVRNITNDLLFKIQ